MPKKSKPVQILKYLLLGGGVVTLSLLAPQSGARLVHALVKAYIRKKQFERNIFLRDLKRLRVRTLIEYRELPDGEVKITLTKEGRREVLKYNLDTIKLDTARPWDGLWRLMMFDIPHSKKRARDALRKKLMNLRFYPVQKSVFITPYECEKEIDFLASIFDVRDHLLIFYVKKFEGEEKLKRHFNLS